MQTITPHAYADSEGLRAMQESDLKACREAWGELHPKTLLAKNNLGVTLHQLGCLPQSRKLLESALKDCRHVRGKNHPDTMRAMNNLAMALYDDGDAASARELMTEVVAWRRRQFGEDHPTTIDAMINLSCMLSALDAHEEEHALDLAVFKVRRRDLGEEHPKTIEALGSLGMSLNNLALDLRKKGNLEDAEPLQWEALAMVEKAFGTDDPITACVYSSTGMLLKLKGDVEQAIAYFHKALEIREKKLGPDAELTQFAGLSSNDLPVVVRSVIRADGVVTEGVVAGETQGVGKGGLTQVSEKILDHEFDDAMDVIVENEHAQSSLGTGRVESVASGQYFGSIVAIDGNRAAQKTGREVVWHDLSNLKGALPKVGEMAEIRYAKGLGIIKQKDMETEIEGSGRGLCRRSK